jgi:hypothetical protein
VREVPLLCPAGGDDGNIRKVYVAVARKGDVKLQLFHIWHRSRGDDSFPLARLRELARALFSKVLKQQIFCLMFHRSSHLVLVTNSPTAQLNLYAKFLTTPPPLRTGRKVGFWKQHETRESISYPEPYLDASYTT